MRLKLQEREGVREDENTQDKKNQRQITQKGHERTEEVAEGKKHRLHYKSCIQNYRGI